MRFSLVIATLGRTEEPRRLLTSLAAQTHRNFEVILVDQNADSRLDELVTQFENRLAIVKLKSSAGVSRARNAGMRVSSGDVICFPDDDCWYSENLLERVEQILTEHPSWDGLVGNSLGADGKRNLPYWDRRGKMTLAMSWRRSVTYTCFLRRGLVTRVGEFDETLGPGSGSAWRSGEDNDYVLRALTIGMTVYYDPKIGIYHPRLFPTYDQARCRKRFTYSLGDGKLLAKHPMPLWWMVLFFALPAGRVVIALLQSQHWQSCFHAFTVCGRVQGYLEAKQEAADAVPDAMLAVK